MLQKAVARSILKLRTDNNTDGRCYIFMNNRYAPPYLLSMMTLEWNLRGIGTCKPNRKGLIL